MRLGRDLFQVLPEGNRLRLSHETRWLIDTAADANFADMYLHPQETSYDLNRLFALISDAGLQFAGFSNPAVWDPERLLSGDLLERARSLSRREQWLLIEDLDPDISHFEFFVAKTQPQTHSWNDDDALLSACGRRQPCLWGWPSTSLLGPDLEPIGLSPAELGLLEAVERQPRTALGSLGLGPETASVARDLLARRLLLLETAGTGA